MHAYAFRPSPVLGSRRPLPSAALCIPQASRNYATCPLVYQHCLRYFRWRHLQRSPQICHRHFATPHGCFCFRIAWTVLWFVFHGGGRVHRHLPFAALVLQPAGLSVWVCCLRRKRSDCLHAPFEQGTLPFPSLRLPRRISGYTRFAPCRSGAGGSQAAAWTFARCGRVSLLAHPATRTKHYGAGL